MKFPCVLENTLLIIRDRSGLSFAIKRIGPPCCTLCYYCYLSLVTNYLAIKLLVTDNFSACRKHLAENCLSFPSAPRWVRHSYLSKGLRLIPYTCGSSPNSNLSTHHMLFSREKPLVKPMPPGSICLILLKP